MRYGEDIRSFFFNRAREDITDDDEWEKHEEKLREEILSWNRGMADPEQLIPLAPKRRDGKKQRLYGATPICYTVSFSTLWWHLPPLGDAAIVLTESEEIESADLKEVTTVFHLWLRDSDSQCWKLCHEWEETSALVLP